MFINLSYSVDKTKSAGIKVISEDLKLHPKCPHGPTLLFEKTTSGGTPRQYYGCAACRNRKDCTFFVWADEVDKISKPKLHAWKCEQNKFLRGVNHKLQFIVLNKIKGLSPHKRVYCKTCQIFLLDTKQHDEHEFIKNITDTQLEHPSQMLPALDNSKKEAQYLFAQKTVEFLVDTFQKLGYKHVICIGTPRIHEYITSNRPNLSSILLDFDRRFHNFFGPLEFCWYNSFNNHFFFQEAKEVFNEFLVNTRGEHTVMITDPPFGGRTEPLSQTFKLLDQKYQKIAGNCLPIFWIFPYFMEPHILNDLPSFSMLDYKIEYDNHAQFHNGTNGRKLGSPIRIFTNVDASGIKLPIEDYKFCSDCNRWVGNENIHCKMCGKCPSKNGETYKHCKLCKKCVKPSWRHCRSCQKCCLIEHKCSQTCNMKRRKSEIPKLRKVKRFKKVIKNIN